MSNIFISKQVNKLLSILLYNTLFLCACTSTKQAGKAPIVENSNCIRDGEYIRLDTFNNITFEKKGDYNFRMRFDSTTIIHKTIEQYRQNKKVGKWIYYVDNRIHKIVNYGYQFSEYIISVEVFNEKGVLSAKLVSRESNSRFTDVYDYIQYDEKGREINRIAVFSELINIDKVGY